jgi:hypothetical protein
VKATAAGLAAGLSAVKAAVEAQPKDKPAAAVIGQADDRAAKLKVWKLKGLIERLKNSEASNCSS